MYFVIIYVSVENADVRVKYTPWIEALCGILPVILILFGGYLVIKNEMTIGQLVTFNGLMWAFTNPINMFGHLVDNTQNFSASADRLYELWKVPAFVTNKENAIDKGDEMLGGHFVRGIVRVIVSALVVFGRFQNVKSVCLAAELLEYVGKPAVYRGGGADHLTGYPNDAYVLAVDRADV